MRPDTIRRATPPLPSWARPDMCGRLVKLVVLLASLGACDDSAGPDEAEATLTGTVRATESSVALAGATVKLGAQTATTDSAGRFELTDIPIGPATLRAERPGYTATEASVTIEAGANSQDLALAAQEIYGSGANATFVPAGVGSIRGVIITLGGPDVSGFVTGERIAPDDRSPELEQTLQNLGASLRQFARSSQLALFGSATVMANSVTSDDAIFGALADVAELSGHPEIAEAPILLMGISAGANEASGMASRQANRTLGLFVRVPSSVSNLASTDALAVPTFVLQAERDEVVSNTGIRETFESNRSRGGLWALAIEPDIGHRNPTSEGNAATINWFRGVLALRLPAASGAPLPAVDKESGWLGNQTSLEIASWAEYAGDRMSASWLLSEAAALVWKRLMSKDEVGAAGAIGSLARE
ncbi:MAG TPA: carboxypeptidase-like regulatory domain-containing protein [Gemmatimonadales bacterium]|nr:carboxypeptidase-like regulatory domain-containing protein [Gemmatimonadales bacterium]